MVVAESGEVDDAGEKLRPHVFLIRSVRSRLKRIASTPFRRRAQNI